VRRGRDEGAHAARYEGGNLPIYTTRFLLFNVMVSAVYFPREDIPQLLLNLNL